MEQGEVGWTVWGQGKHSAGQPQPQHTCPPLPLRSPWCRLTPAVRKRLVQGSVSAAGNSQLPTPEGNVLLPTGPPWPYSLLPALCFLDPVWS